jgi:predicted nucleic acid-binding protein
MTTARDTFLADTNLLVYAIDRRDPVKQARAIETLDALHTRRSGALSVQVVGEFFTVATGKLAQPLSVSEGARIVFDYLASWPVLDLSAAIVADALRGLQRYQLAYWDALIWATARANEIPVILSEDFNDGASLDSVRFLNPFNPAFDLAALL